MHIKKINQTIKSTQSKLYICIWNGEGDGDENGEIVEIHTLKTLLHKYADIKEDYFNKTALAYSGLTWKEIFTKLDRFKITSHLEDNMYIKRIK